MLSTTDHLCDVLLELRLVGGLIAKERVDGLNYHILQYRLIDGSCVAFLSGWLQSTDAAPDDGFAAAIVPVNSDLFITAMFDPTIDNEGGGSLEKEDGIVEIFSGKVSNDTSFDCTKVSHIEFVSRFRDEGCTDKLGEGIRDVII